MIGAKLQESCRVLAFCVFAQNDPDINFSKITPGALKAQSIHAVAIFCVESADIKWQENVCRINNPRRAKRDRLPADGKVTRIHLNLEIETVQILV